ncbi:carboxypeptidase regulatory-like domain-containing protein [Goodfellowiella coeruleoviolacea]|uniref:Carboxypeptidase regulatory-like domain-containing protein n=1 Tax=Goodfellowiella coeruleoviolacea TaxID=334858 RepID=A0AAE3G9G2_9PSEU|nr:carboxypeptidase regulatory-like domain-containing protein [Goodfellowiella coeruleoviolacea]MCP2164005.1 Carboxypeptidase regulatory-like domain-containing protein [Goodfellowiella coeruleoviolacea]
MAEQDQVDQTERQPTWRVLVESLWFPAFFFLGFLFCYLLAFHNPTPHHVPVAVANPAVAQQIGTALNQASPGAFDVEAISGTAEDARQAVLDRDVVAGYAVDASGPVLYVAKADGYMLEQVLTKTFTSIAAQTGHQLTVTDVAPTAGGDAMGTGLFYLAMAWNIPAYITVMMLLRATISRRNKVLTLLGVGAVFSVLGFYVGVAMDVIPNDPAVIPVAFLLTQAVALPSYGLVPFVKQFFPGVAMGLFVMLSMPSSGGAVPHQLVPPFFGVLHPVMPLGNLVDAARGIFYFDGAGVLRPVLVLCAWVLLGVALIGGHALAQRRAEQRAEGGGELAEVAEPPVEDPAVEMPRPTALPTRGHHFGEQLPALLGAVRTAEGEPVVGVAVTITNGHGRQLVRTTTDQDGRYAISGLSEQFVNVVVSAPDWAPAARRVLIREGGTARQDFALRPRQSAAQVLARH